MGTGLYNFAERTYTRKESVLKPIVIFRKVIPHIETIHSPRAMAFAIKGLYLYHNSLKSKENLILIKTLANRLVKMYKRCI